MTAEGEGVSEEGERAVAGWRRGGRSVLLRKTQRVRVLVNRVSSPRELRIRAYRFKHIPRCLTNMGNYNIS